MARGIEDYDKVTLGTIGEGALSEMFDVMLDKVMKNIDDPNTVDGKCEINLKITINPNSKGSAADFTLSATCKVQPDLPVETMAYLGKQGAKLVAWEHNPEQMKLPMPEGDLQEVEGTLSIGGIKQ